jgi:hypothetical protein
MFHQGPAQKNFGVCYPKHHSKSLKLIAGGGKLGESARGLAEWSRLAMRTVH